MIEPLPTAVRGLVRTGTLGITRAGVVPGLVTVAWASLVANGLMR